MHGTMNLIEINAEIIADSVSESGVRLTTMALIFPRIILPEFNTHRMFSRNARSTRAVPTSRLIKEVRESPFVPVYFGLNKPGMQASEEMTVEAQAAALDTYLASARFAADSAEKLVELGLHKQHAGRIVEPYTWTYVCVTATEWDNWFYERDHEDAQPEIRLLAQKMQEAMEASKPKLLRVGDWHLPYLTDEDIALDKLSRLKVSIARCARVSYKNFDGTKPSVLKDLELYEKLVGDPPHLSPTEHQATPLDNADEWSGNFRGWQQFRKTLEAA